MSCVPPTRAGTAAPVVTGNPPEEDKVTPGVPPAELSDDDLERELAHLHETRRETFLHGSEDALDAHTGRMLGMEKEYLRRFPDRAAPDPMRVRASNRRLSGQD